MGEMPYGWGWSEPDLVPGTLAALRKITAGCKGVATREEKRVLDRARLIIGRYCVDNASDVLGSPIFFGPLKKLLAEIEIADEQTDRQQAKGALK